MRASAGASRGLADARCLPGEAQPGGLGREAEELLRQHLKRRHAASILSLKEEFMRKRKKGKLPKDATTSLKTWWTSNLVWPYPSVRARHAPRVCGGPDWPWPCVQDEDKRALGDDTGLNATQINNCASFAQSGERQKC